METKANTALIGAFALIVMALGFVFIYWLARGSDQGSSVPLTVVFEYPVTGLTAGSQVLFNGINIGAVKTLELDENRNVVLAHLRIKPLRSIKTNTEVTLGFQGLTGAAFVQMVGGSPDLPPIWEAMPKEPRLTASRSGMQDLLANARDIMKTADTTLRSVQKIVSENEDDVAQAVKDVRAFTGALAANSDKVADLIDQVSTASAGIADAAQRLQGIAERSEALIGAVDPEQVRSTLADLSATTANIAEQTQKLGPIVERADAIAADLQSFSQHLPALGERVDVLVAAIDPEKLAGTLDRMGEIATAIDPAKVGGALDRIDAVVGAVDPEQVRTTLANVATMAETLAARSEAIGAIATNVESFSQRLPALGERADALVAAIDPAKVSASLDRLDAITAAVDPERVKVTVDAVSGLAETLQANRENIDTIVTRVTSLSNDLSAFATRLPAMGERTDALLAALDTTKLAQTVDNVTQFTTTLAENRDDIDAIVADARNVAARFNSIGDRAESLLTKLDAMAGEGSGGVLGDAQATLAAIRVAADSFNTQINAVGDGIGDFSGRGLRDFQNMVTEGQRTISRLDRVISNLEQNPSGFIFGGETVPEYNGRRR